MRALPLPEGVPAGIEAWLLELDVAAPIQPADWAVLSVAEVNSALRYRQRADQVRAVATRAALRRLLGERLRVAPASLRFGANTHGKPLLEGGAGLVFNVSHSGACAVIALGLAPGLEALGIDIERHNPDLDFNALASMAFTPLERAFLSRRGLAPHGEVGALPGFLSAFFTCWSGKEAVLKAVGVGIPDYLQQVSVRPLRDARFRVNHRVAQWRPLQACRLAAPPHYSAAVAWQAQE